VQWLDHHRIAILHQYHKIKLYEKDQQEFGKQQTDKNSALWRRMRKTKQVKRNDENWGNLSISLVNDYRN
jgi:uncharacterized protein YhjY with autotransporter beta-barrel domain